MRRSLRKWMFLFALGLATVMVIGLEQSFAQQYFTFVGKVVGISRGNISVQGDKGEFMDFAVGRRTVYTPKRLPGVGERIKVSYYFQRGHNVGSQVEIIPPPPPKK